LIVISIVFAAILALYPQNSMADDVFLAFPTGIAEKMEKSAKEKADPGLMKPIICNGSEPKFKPKAHFIVKYVEASNLMLDDASKLKQKKMQNFRDYLKYYYFAGISGDVDKGDEYQAYVEQVGEPIYASDLGLLRATYTFKIPQETLEGVFKAHGALSKQYFGYDFDTGKYSPRLAVEHRDWMWQKFLANQTVVKEAPKGNDFISFHVELDLSMFCAFGLNAMDLVSK
jgi:hypothetical protein